MLGGRLERILEYWYSTSSAAGREELLFSAGHASLLRELWVHSPDRPDWLSVESAAGFHLVAVLSETSVSVVCAALRADGEVCCVKFPRLDRGLRREQDVRRRGLVRHEAEVLRRLAGMDLRSAGSFSEWAGDGVFESVEWGAVPWLATKYQRGLRPLKVALRDMDVSERLRVLACLADRVDELHRVGLVHGDLHVGNVFVRGEDLSPVVLDFGLAEFVRHGVVGRRRVRVRQFGPAIPIWAHERCYAGMSLTPAMDVLCLGILAGDLLEDCFGVVGSEEVFGGGVDLSSGHGAALQSRRLRLLLEESSWPEPEYRPQSAGDFAAGLRGVVGGPAIRSRRTGWLEFGVWLRRYGLLSSVGLVAVLAVMGLFWQRQWVRTERAERLAAAAELSMRRSETKRERLEGERTWEAACYLALAGASLAAGADPASVGGVDGESFRRLRADVGGRLISLMGMQRGPLTEPSRVLELVEGVVLLTRAMLEREGFAAGLRLAEASVAAASALVERLSGADRLRAALFCAELRGMESACCAQLGRRGESAGAGVGVGVRVSGAAAGQAAAEAGVREFLRCSVEEIRRAGLVAQALRTAFVLADQALYPQRETEWLRLAERSYVREVLGHALECAGAGSAAGCLGAVGSEEERFWLAAVLTTRGLHGHKGSLNRSEQNQEQRTVGVRRDLECAAEVLDGLLSAKVTGVVVRDDVQMLRGRVDSLLCMSFLNGWPRDVERAIGLGESALLRRGEAAERDPGSLRKRREVIASGWNLCDALMAAAADLSDEGQRRLNWRRESEVRRQMVREAAWVLERDRSSQSLQDYGVNATRLMATHLLLGEDGVAEAQLGEMQAAGVLPGESWEGATEIPLIVVFGQIWVREGTEDAEEDLASAIRRFHEHIEGALGRGVELADYLRILERGFRGREAIRDKLRTRADWRDLERLLGIGEDSI